MTAMENNTTPTPGAAPGEPTKQTLTIEEIMALLPHRYPFLLIDRVVEVERKKRIVAIKNVTINEPFFQGHFPDYPIMPGVLVVEAMAQSGGLLILLDIEDPASKLLLFTGVDGAKFRRPIKPGDQLRIEVNVLQLRARAVRLEGKAYVDGKLACEATLSCGLVPREKKKPEASVEEAPAPVELHAVTTE
jgi:3-hydroxyacyl-[acyl-carrier-protein] dehydratase